MGLFVFGSPDEYDPEVKTIIAQLDNKMNEQQVHDLVYQEFLRWFNSESIIGEKENFKKLAFDIHEWIKK